MSTLTVTARGQVTFRKEVLKHFGIKPGDKIELDLVAGKKGILQAARPKRKIEEVFGILKNKTTKVATIEEMNEAAQKGWAGLL